MKKGMDRNECLYLLFEKCILLKTVCKSTRALVDFDLIMTDIAEYLSNENLKVLALKYLELSNPKQANVALLKERIFISESTKTCAKYYAKPA